MNNQIIAERVVIGFIRLIPWKLRPLIYKWPGLSSRIRNILNRIFSSRPTSVFTITAGPLKGKRIELNIRYDKSFWLATHEPHLQAALAKIIRPGWIAYDIGAYIGYYTMLFSLLCREEGKVLAFEPEPNNYFRLTNNIAYNNLSNVEIFMTAISDQSGWGDFRPGNTPAQGILVREMQISDLSNCMKTRVNSLDDMVFLEGASPPRIIKIDVEGNEDRVLTGMSRVLKEFRPVIICEVHTPLLGREICDNLAGAAYLLFEPGRDMKNIQSGAEWGGRHLLAVPEEDQETRGRIVKA